MLPDDFCGDVHLRLSFYKKLATAKTPDQISDLLEELVDRFGKLPGPALNLTYQARLKIAASGFGAQSITTDGNRITIRADAIEKIPRVRLERLLGEDGIIGRRQVTYSRSGTPEQWKARLMEVAHALAGMAASALV